MIMFDDHGDHVRYRFLMEPKVRRAMVYRKPSGRRYFKTRYGNYYI